MKLPALQFYPGDWHKDQGVQALSLEERGAWFEMLLMMHDSDERGVLVVNGQPMPEAVIARRLGLDNQKFNQILTTLLTYGVTSRRGADGAIICRRMIRDENLRRIRTEAGKKGGNPNLVKQNPNQNPTSRDKQNPTPSSSVSSSDEIHTEERPSGMPSTPEEAVSRTQTLGVPDKFVTDLWEQMEARGWVDGAGQAVRNWPYYVKQRWEKQKDKDAREAARRNGHTVHVPAGKPVNKPLKTSRQEMGLDPL